MLVDINLLPEKESERSTLLIAALCVLSAAILVSLILFLVAQSYTKQSGLIEQQITKLHSEQEDVQASLQVSEFAADKQALASTVMWAEHYQFDTVPLLAGLVRLLPERGFFETFEFASPNTAVLMVQFNTTGEAAYYLTRLQGAEFIDTVTLESVTAEEIDRDNNEEVNHLLHTVPRYLAVYHVSFYDERIVPEKEDDEDEGGIPIE